jgi:serine protease Do
LSTADGLIVTSRHVLAGSQSILVTVPGRAPVPAQVLGHDDAVDVTVLRVPFTGLVPLAVGSSRGLRPGHWVLACGSPYGLERSWSAGIVSGLHRRGVAARPGTYEDFIQSDAAANLGNSGGPLLDGSGRVVGMVTQILTRAGGFQGVSLATPIEAVLEAAERITKAAGGGAVGRPSLGVMVREVAAGLEVTRVPAGSPAQAAGLRPGDVVFEVQGADARTAAALARALWGRSVGETVRLRVARGPTVVELTLPLR